MNFSQLRVSKQKATKFQELRLISKALKLEDQLVVGRNMKLWETLKELMEGDNDPSIIVYCLTLLSALCFDDESCYRIRIHCGYLVCQLLLNHITTLNPGIQGSYV